MTITREEGFALWLATRPPAVQALGKQFPIGTRFIGVNGRLLYLVGYSETGEGGAVVKVSQIDPAVDYDGALASTQHLCNEHLKLKTDD